MEVGGGVEGGGGGRSGSKTVKYGPETRQVRHHPGIRSQSLQYEVKSSTYSVPFAVKTANMPPKGVCISDVRSCLLALL